MRRRPLVVIALAYAAGIGMGLRFFAPVAEFEALLFAGLCLVVSVVFVLCDRITLGGWWALLAVGSLGVVVAGTARSRIDTDVLQRLPEQGAVVTMRGQIVKDAVFEERGRKRFGVLSDRLHWEEHRLDWDGRGDVLIYGYLPDLPVYGEQWRFEGKLYRYATMKKVRWTMVVWAEHAERSAQADRTIQVLSQNLRRDADRLLRKGIESFPDVQGVVSALLLGYRTQLPSSVESSFRRTGTMHIFAISGLHVGIIGAVMVFVVSLFRLPRTCWVWVLGPVILLYALTTGGRPSAVRAGVMFMLFLLAPLVGRRADAWSSLGMASILILSWRPSQLYDPGFVFSFMAVMGILSLMPLFERVLQRWLALDTFLPEDEEWEWWRYGLLWLGRLAGVSFAAWLSTTPLSLYYFGRIAPIALVANFVVLPMAFLIVVTGCLGLLASLLVGLSGAVIFNSANIVFVRILTHSMAVLESVPFAHFANISFPLVGVWLWYALCALLIVICSFRGRRTVSLDFDELDA